MGWPPLTRGQRRNEVVPGENPDEPCCPVGQNGLCHRQRRRDDGNVLSGHEIPCPLSWRDSRRQRLVDIHFVHQVENSRRDPSCHRVVFVREDNGPVVLDSKKTSNKRPEGFRTDAPLDTRRKRLPSLRQIKV